MARRARGGRRDEIARAILEEFGAETADEAQEALRQTLGPTIEAMLRAELDAHLGYASNDKSPKATANRRNGYTPQEGEDLRRRARDIGPQGPRRSFEPVAVPKGGSDLSDVESRVISMCARGMSRRDAARTVREIYGFSMSAETVSAITDRVWEDLGRWRSRPLEPVYAFMFAGCLYVPVRDGRGARNAAVYAVLAHDLRGLKDALGLWTDDSEGSHRWMQVFDELRARGVEDVLYVSSDGVAGLGEGLRAVFPHATHQRCIVHLVRGSLRYVPQKEAAAFCRSMRAVYGAPSLASAESAWEAFRREWPRYPGAVAVWERSLDQVRQLFSCGSEVRRVMYTTSALELVNASFRKVVRRGSFPGEEAVMKLLYLRVLELYRKWGEGCHHAGWSQVRNQLLCDEGVRPRIEGYL